MYLVLQGKVRLVDAHRNLIDTLEVGAAWGETTLFPAEFPSAYSARTAKEPAKICWIPTDSLRPLLQQYPEIRDQLHQRATSLNNRINGQADPTDITPRSRPTVSTDIQPRSGRPKQPEPPYVRPTPFDTPSNTRIQKAFFPSPGMQVEHWWRHTVRRYPFFAQQSASDCGAACLVMIGQYWGKQFSVNQLRESCNVDRNGASLGGMMAAAEQLGFSARPVKANLSQLTEQPLPAIVHWEGKHFIVVHKITRRSVIVCDPAIGQRALSPEQFINDWTGYALILQPTIQLKQTPDAKRSFWQFWALLQPHKVVGRVLDLWIVPRYLSQTHTD